MKKYINTKAISIRRLNIFLETNNSNSLKLDITERVKIYCNIKGYVFTDISNIYSFLSNEFVKRSKRSIAKASKKENLKKKEERHSEYQKYLKSNKWKAIRKFILEDRNKSCERCNKKPLLKFLHVHHKTYVRIFNEQMSDLELLCVDCHRKHHKK
jgi:hypothetical protein